MKIDAIKIRQIDNVATALRPLEKQDRAKFYEEKELREVVIVESIPYGHKFATQDIIKGEDIIKYGEVIGRATKDITSGSHAHIQNIESLRGRGDLERE